MSNFVVYLLDPVSDTFKNLHVLPKSDEEARTTAYGSDAIVFKDGVPWKIFDNHGATYTITEE
ncbi:hypothetical protein [Bradyrhizobium sp. USDA 4353]